MGEKNYTSCPHRKLGLKGDCDNSYSCLLTGRPDADHRSWGYDSCMFLGGDFTKCSVYRSDRNPETAHSPLSRIESKKCLIDECKRDDELPIPGMFDDD